MSVKLKVNDKEIPLNEFVENILGSTISGAVTTLHGVDGDWKKIDIQIEKSTR